MMFKMTFTNGKCLSGGTYTVSSRIPPSVFAEITQTKSSAEAIVALLNAAERLHSYRQMNSLAWNICQHCQTIFLAYRKDKNQYCGRACNGYYRGQDWAKHAHKGRAAWTEKSVASFSRKMSGQNNPAWKGGVTYFRKHGNYKPIKYVRCPAEFMAMARKDGYVMEHRLLVAQAMGRCLLRSEVVHHRNHDPQDNALSNLAVFVSNRAHKLHEHGHPIEPIWPTLSA
jgi:hypothetical protein